MLPFKTVCIFSGIVAALSLLAFLPWVMGVPGVENEYARGWKIGFTVILSYPTAWVVLYLPYFLFKNRVDEVARTHWQDIASGIAVLLLLIASARMFQAFKIMLDK